jgi:truncated hemoglobin YjbI
MMTKGREPQQKRQLDETERAQWLAQLQGTDFLQEVVNEEFRRTGQADVHMAAAAGGTQVKSIEGAFFMADLLARSGAIPKAWMGKDDKPNIPGLVIAMLAGQRVGLDALASVQKIMVVNGIPSLWGGAPLAICMTRPDVFDVSQLDEWWEFDGQRENRQPGVEDWQKGKVTACATVCRVGGKPYTFRFSVDDAKKAGLWGSEKKLYGPYPQRMLKHRALGFAITDRFQDVLLGLGIQGVTTVEQDDEDDQEPPTRQSVLDRVAATVPREMGPKEPLPELKLDEAAFTRDAQPREAVPVAPEAQVANVAPPAALADLVNEVLPAAKPAEVAPQAATTGEPDLWTLKADKIATLRKLGGNWNVRPEALDRILVEGTTRPGCYDENELLAAIKAEMKAAIPPGGSAASRGNV